MQFKYLWSSSFALQMRKTQQDSRLKKTGAMGLTDKTVLFLGGKITMVYVTFWHGKGGFRDWFQIRKPKSNHINQE